MTPHEKAVHALNRRIEGLQALLREAGAEAARQALFEAVVVTLGLGDAFNDYARTLGQYAKSRHGELKQAQETLTARHAELLKSGQEVLEQFKAKPTDRALRKELDRVQHEMESIQKTLRRGANALQRDVAPGIALLDPLAESLRRLAEADAADALKRPLRSIVGHVRELYAAQPALPARDIVDAAAWEKSAVAEIDQAAGFHDAYTRVGYQALLALALMTLAVSDTPPETGAEATRRANEAVAARLKEITGRFTAEK